MLPWLGCFVRTSPHAFCSLFFALSCIWLGSAAAEAQGPAPVPPPPASAAPDPAYPAPPPAYAPAPYYAQPGYNYVPPAPPPRRYRPRKGLMIGGISMLSATYLAAVVSGAALLDLGDEACDECKKIGGLLLIPFAGPFAAIPHVVDGEGMLALLGSLQLVGAALTVGGVMLYRSTKKRAEEQGMIVLDLRAGRSLALDLSTHPYRAGPLARLRF
jgi:hypothetical protein